jgi:DNA-binding NtrC family response regulator
MVEEGKFREDLWYRLDVVRIQVPPLRERAGDLPLLAGAFLKRYNERYGLDARLTESGLRALCETTWPGNIRQLQHILERLAILSPGGRITEDAVADALRPARAAADSGETLASTEAEQIRKVLAATNNNKSRAARILGIERKTLYRKIERMGIEGS